MISDSESSESEPEVIEPIVEEKKSKIEKPKRVLTQEQKDKMKAGREKAKALRNKSKLEEKPELQRAEEPKRKGRPPKKVPVEAEVLEEPKPKRKGRPPKIQVEEPVQDTKGNTYITNNYITEKPKKETKVKVKKETKPRAKKVLIKEEVPEMVFS